MQKVASSSTFEVPTQLYFVNSVREYGILRLGKGRFFLHTFKQISPCPYQKGLEGAEGKNVT